MENKNNQTVDLEVDLTEGSTQPAEDVLAEEIETIDDSQGGQEIQQVVDQQFRVKRRKTLWAFLGVFAILLILVLAGLGVYFYDKNFKKVAFEDVFPGNYQLNARIDLDFDNSNQALIKSQLDKLEPIISFMEKLDELSGEGKDLKQGDSLDEMSIREKLASHLESYGVEISDQELMGVFDETLYLSIPSIDPLKKGLQKVVMRARQNELLGQYKESQLADLEKLLAITSQDKRDYVDYKLAEVANEKQRSSVNVAGEKQGPVKVLAMTSDRYYLMAEGDAVEKTDWRKSINSLDYILGFKIKDAKKAKQILKGVGQKLEKSKFGKMKYQGFEYYEIALKNPDEKETEAQKDADFLVKSDKIFVALVGDNLMISNQEASMKDVLERRKALSFLPTKKSSLTTSLKSNLRLAEIWNQTNLSGKAQEIVSLSLEMNLDDFMQISDGVTQKEAQLKKSRLLVYPSDYIGAFSFGVGEEGFVVATLDNQGFLPDIKNFSLDNGLSKKIPAQVDGMDETLFFELNKLKDFYYSFKKNRLSDEGRKELEQLNTRLAKLGLNLEREFFDQLAEGFGLAVYSKPLASYQSVITSKITNKGMFLGTMEKLVDFIRESYLKAGQVYIEMYESSCLGYDQGIFDEMGMSEEEKDSFIDYCDYWRPNYLEAKVNYEKGKDFSLKKTVLDSGEMYSFALEGIFFDFGITADNHLVFGNRREGVLKTMDYLTGREKGETIAETGRFKNFLNYSTGEGYLDLVMQPGVFGHILYDGLNSAGMLDSFGLSEDDFMIADLVLKPIDLVGYSSKFDEKGFKKGMYYVKLIDMTKEDKDMLYQYMTKLNGIVNFQN